MTRVIELITIEDLTPDLQMLAEVCGLDMVKKMLLSFAGINFYVPKISRLESVVEKYMKLNNNKSFNEMARDLGVSAQYLKNIYKKQFSKDLTETPNIAKKQNFKSNTKSIN